MMTRCGMVVGGFEFDLLCKLGLGRPRSFGVGGLQTGWEKGKHHDHE